MAKKFLNIQHKSLEELGAKTYQELWQKAQSEGYQGIAVCVNTVFTKSADADNKFHAIFSTANEDRHGDIVEQDWDLRAFKKNPVFLDSHNYDSIEHIIGKITNIKKDKILEGDIEFHMANPKGVLAQAQVQDGFASATSVGFIPKEFNDKGNILKSELLEVSMVSVPANSEALFEKKEAGKIEPEKIEEEKTEEPKKEITEKIVSKKERMYKAISRLAKEQENQIKTLNKCIKELILENKQSRKSEIHKIVRSLLKE